MRALFICGSMNQTTQMHQIAKHLRDVDCWFTRYYGDGILEYLRRKGLLENTILGDKLAQRCMRYLKENNLKVDERGTQGNYDLVVTCSDLVVPRNIRASLIVLVQEGMTDPETWRFDLVRRYSFLPRWIAGTAATGLSGLYDCFCVASRGYCDFFIAKGAESRKIVVTGIPNFDNCATFKKNNFPYQHFVLVCTSDLRETFNRENRRKFIRHAVRIAAGRQLIFKLHPNENVERAKREIATEAPGALVFLTGNTEEMIANCDVLITRVSTTIYVGLALGKECYSDFSLAKLRHLMPIQNGGMAALNIAEVCTALLDARKRSYLPQRPAVSMDRALRAVRRKVTSPFRPEVVGL